MQFISKFKYKRKGHRIVKSFIRGQWDYDNKRYINLKYNELKREKKFKYLLLKEQQGFCCYCMRKIPLEDVTLEHVIPHHIKDEARKDAQIIHYRKFGRLKRKNVYYCPDIDIPSFSKLRTPPYPHCIAHENLVASCNGKVFDNGEEYVLHKSKCCNNFRGNEEIIPLFFIPRAAEIICYEIDGTLTYFEKYDSTIKLLNLNHCTLTLMRKVWARIVINNISLNSVNKALMDSEVRNDIIDDIDIEISERRKLKVDLYWKLLADFYWFYGYFQKKMA